MVQENLSVEMTTFLSKFRNFLFVPVLLLLLLLLLYSPQFEVLLPDEAHDRTLRYTWCIWNQLLAFM